MIKDTPYALKITGYCIYSHVCNFIYWKNENAKDFVVSLICGRKPSEGLQCFSFIVSVSGKRAFIAGVADDNGYGWAIAKALAAAGAEILVGTWVPVCWSDSCRFPCLGQFCWPIISCSILQWQALNIFETSLRRGKFDESRQSVL